MASLAEYERELIRKEQMPDCKLQEQEEEPEIDQRYTTETISNCCCFVLFYKDITKIPEDIYKPFELTRVTFY